MQELISRHINPEIRAIQGEDRTFDFVISTEAVDSYGTVFLSEGWDLTRYESNPVVCYNHQAFGPDPDTIIGTSSVRREGNQLVARLTLEEGNPIADKVARKLANGILRGASIGAIPDEGRWGNRDAGEDPEVIYFTKQRLVEWSVVSLPSNPEALKRSRGEEAFIATLPKETTNPRAEESRDGITARILLLKST